MGHVVLLGDSIFDNAPYVRGGDPVVVQVGARLPAGWRATLLARDGSVAGDVAAQLARLPDDASHLVLSAGGNDALRASGILQQPARSVGEALAVAVRAGHAFEQDYRRAVAAVLARRLPTTLCTIYYPHFPDPHIQELTSAGLVVFNDAILRTAFTLGLPVIDLRLICTEAGDYANEIEPSSRGGAKIAEAVARAVTGQPAASAVFVRH